METRDFEWWYENGETHSPLRLGLVTPGSIPCDSCGGREEALVWFNADRPGHYRALSLYVCRRCLVKALGGTFEGGKIDFGYLQTLFNQSHGERPNGGKD